jgi:hypothetical protein
MHRLRATIPSARIARYDAACEGTAIDPMDLYRWASGVALATFDDLSTLEVAMRSAMARELANSYGLDWYRRTNLLDDDTLKLVNDAWRVGRLSTLDAPPEVLHGKLVATLMFGFWVKILGRGGYQGRGEGRERRIYDTLLWKPALRNAFPNVGDVERSTVETAARRVQALRNRVAHHEHIVWGVPLAGERRKDDSVRRLGVSQMHETVLSLAGYIDGDLKIWLRENSDVPAQIARCPLPDTSKLQL